MTERDELVAEIERWKKRAERAEAACVEFRDAASCFGSRVMERCPSWFEEKPGTTDFADANKRLKVAIADSEPGSHLLSALEKADEVAILPLRPTAEVIRGVK